MRREIVLTQIGFDLNDFSDPRKAAGPVDQ
jgi:hypothetical protein